MGKKKYYDMSKLLSCKCNWMILYGMRANGKSYQVKLRALKRAYENDERFVLLRRWSEDIKQKQVSTYFDDMNIKEITKGAYNTIQAYQGFFYFANLTEDLKVERAPEPIGRYCALNEAERYKSQVFDKVERIIFEEFMTDKLYLGSQARPEPRLLMQFVSTVARDRDIEVFLIGNTVSRVSPYVSEWSLKGFLQQKPGTIDIYHLRGENGIVDIAVENCEVVETKSKMFFGLASKQITSGEWEVDDVPKLLKPYEYYDMLYELGIKYNDFSFCVQLMFDGETGGAFVYVYPNTKGRKIDRIITTDFSVNPMITKGLKPEIRAESLMARCFRDGKVCFSDNLTGTDFRQITDTFDLRGVRL